MHQQNRKINLAETMIVMFSIWDTMFWKTLDASTSKDSRKNKQHIFVQTVEITALKWKLYSGRKSG